jgi:hypothetical protein
MITACIKGELIFESFVEANRDPLRVLAGGQIHN